MAQVIVALKERELSCHQLGERTLIGRDPASEIFIDNTGISRHHASIARTSAGYSVRDEGSQNGMFVNGELVRERVLAEGDVIQVGKFLLHFSEVDSARARPSTQPPPRHDTDPRALLQTFALRPDDVKKLMGEGYQPSSFPPPELSPTVRRQPSSGGAWPLWLIVLTGAAALVLVAWFSFLLARR